MNKLKAKRRAAGITLDELAHKIGVNASTLYRIEAGYSTPSPVRTAAIEQGIKELAVAKAKIRQVARELGLCMSS